MAEKQNSDWGKELGDALQRALQTGDYTRLRQTVNTTVHTVVDKTIQCATKAEHAAERIIDQNLSQFQQNQHKEKGPGRPPHAAPPRPPRNESVKAQPKPASTVIAVKTMSPKPVALRRANGDTALGVLMATTGFLGAVPALTATFLLIFRGLLDGVVNLLPLIGAAALGTVGVLCLVLASAGCRRFGRARRLRQYWDLVSGKGFCTLQAMADAVEKPVRYVVKDLNRMLASGAFPGGHLADDKSCLIVGDDLYRQYREAQTSMQRRSEQEKLHEDNAVLAAGADAIRQIRTANDALPGIEISDKLNKLEQVTTHIFAYVEQRPAKLPDIRRFMDYYLPTAIKLVRSYQDFESQPQTESVVAAKAEILAILDTINQAFSTLLDGLFQDDAMDISTDISALKTMLAQEGLTNNVFNKEKSL